MRVFLVNPSDVRSAPPSSPRAGCMCSPRPPREYGDPRHRRRDAGSLRHRADRSRRRRRHRHPHGQRAAGLRRRAAGARARRVGGVRRHPRHALPGRGPRTRRRARGRQGRRRRGLAARCWPTAPRASRSRSTTAGACRAATLRARRAGTCCRRDRYMWASVQTVRGLPETLLVLLGVADRRPGAAAAGRWTTSSQEIVELRRRGFRFIALADDNFYPVTLDGPRAGGRAPERPDARWQSCEALRAERFELMERLARAAAGHGLLHADHDGSRRGPGVPRRDAQGAHPRRAGGRRGGDRRRGSRTSTRTST